MGALINHLRSLVVGGIAIVWLSVAITVFVIKERLNDELP
jgi:hypothetical protein